MFIASLGIYKKLSKKRSNHIGNYLLPLIKEQNCRILDFGGGNMWLAQLIGKNKPEVKIIGIDVIEDQNLDKQIFTNPNVSFQTYSSKEVPFADETFDYVIASAVMHHTPSPEFYFTELKRLIKPGGSILLVEEMYRNPLDKIYIMAEDYILNKLKKGVPVPLEFRSINHYLNLFKELELKIDFQGHIRPGFPWKHHDVFKLSK